MGGQGEREAAHLMRGASTPDKLTPETSRPAITPAVKNTNQTPFNGGVCSFASLWANIQTPFLNRSDDDYQIARPQSHNLLLPFLGA